MQASEASVVQRSVRNLPCSVLVDENHCRLCDTPRAKSSASGLTGVEIREEREEGLYLGAK